MARKRASRYVGGPGFGPIVPTHGHEALPSGSPEPLKHRLIKAQLQGERAGRGAAQSAFSLAPEGMDEKAFETVLDVGDAIDTACQVAQRIAKKQIEKKMPAFETEAERKAFLAGANWSSERCLRSICDTDRTSPCAVDEEEQGQGALLGLGCGCGRRR